MYFQHNAGNEGFCGTSYGSLDGEGNGVAIFTNHQNTPLLYELLNSVARVYKWKDFPGMPETRKEIKPDEKTVRKYLGVYQALPNTFTHLMKKDDGYYLYADGSSYKMYFTSDTSYFNKEFQNEKHFLLDKNGNVKGYVRFMDGKWQIPHIRLSNLDTLKGTEDFFNTVSWHLIESKEFDEALKYLKRAFDFYPNSLSLRGNEAHTYLLSGNYEKAIAIYKAHMNKMIWDGLTWEKMIQNDLTLFKINGFDTKLMDKVFAELKIEKPEGYK